MHNEHAWKTTTADGEKREVRAVKFGGVWRLQAKLKASDTWEYYDEPPIDDLEELRDILFRKYQRRRAAYEDVALVENWIKRRRAEERAG